MQRGRSRQGSPRSASSRQTSEGPKTPHSVMMPPVMSSCGVTSKDGFHTSASAGRAGGTRGQRGSGSDPRQGRDPPRAPPGNGEGTGPPRSPGNPPRAPAGHRRLPVVPPQGHRALTGRSIAPKKLRVIQQQKLKKRLEVGIRMRIERETVQRAQGALPKKLTLVTAPTPAKDKAKKCRGRAPPGNVP
ncbi:collagen alpha-1(XIV) chain-like isoform X1 [Hirundo rustica]|uniref:collagen alpha-1(XIV) chain-like isoform X1 n=1 Tax=Hirundo rustica TaxID=43150 RepID=UPI001A9534F3|nr:collagen alpha-1(XIV) chain-like isoform X1 [Hirundo rustica]